MVLHFNMSFKREGNDGHLLKNLSHQRVRELLSVHIPQDEAKLLSNGRLACTICNYRPIFDTINMLSLHRQGKRHLRELSAFIKCKEDAAIKALTKCSPNNVEVKSLNMKTTSKNGRKPILELPKSRISTKLSPVLSSPNQPDGKSASACVRSYLKNMSRKSSLHRVIEKNRENYGADLYKCNQDVKTTAIQNSMATLSSKGNSTKVVQAQDYEIKLRMSGWVKDSSGNWIKDPNVEFDSDEDDVPPPPPT